MKVSATAKWSTHLRGRVAALQRRLDRATAALTFAATPRAIHGARVAVRRLRVLLRAQRGDFDAAAAKRYRRLLKGLTRDLEPAREADVARRELVQLASGRGSHAAFVRGLHQRAELEYKAAVHRLRARMAVPSWRQELMDIGEASMHARLVNDNAEPAAAAMNRLLDHQRQRLRAAMGRAGARPSRLHRIRLKIKSLRYLLEDGLSSAAARDNSELKHLRLLQDCLGELHDQETLLKALRRRYGRRHKVRPVCGKIKARKRRYVRSFKRHRKRLMRLWTRSTLPENMRILQR